MARALRARNGRPTHSAFAQLVQTLPVPDRMLGLTHVTSSYSLRDVLLSGLIVADEPCRILEEPVTYAFYGRAAFRSKFDNEPSDLTSLFPSVLILDPERVPTPKYVFGFDSGAFMEGLMDQYLHPYMPLFDFLLEPDPRSAARLIQAVFPSAGDYLTNKPVIKFTVPASNYEAECYAKLVTGGGHAEPRLDDRASTPELLFADPIDVRECVVAAVIPSNLSDDPAIGGRLRRLDVRVLDYPWTSCSRPGENHFLLRGLVYSVYEDLGWI